MSPLSSTIRPQAKAGHLHPPCHCTRRSKPPTHAPCPITKLDLSPASTIPAQPQHNFSSTYYPRFQRCRNTQRHRSCRRALRSPCYSSGAYCAQSPHLWELRHRALSRLEPCFPCVASSLIQPVINLILMVLLGLYLLWSYLHSSPSSMPLACTATRTDGGPLAIPAFIVMLFIYVYVLPSI